jgi:hypothetical protein
VVHHPWRVILPIVLLTFFFAWQIPQLRFETSIYDLTIEDLPQTREYNIFKKTFGCEEIVLVVARTPNVFDATTFGTIDRLAGQFEKIKGVRRVISLPGIKRAMDVTGKWTLSDFKRKIAPVILLEKNIVSKDGKTTVISLILEDIKQKDPVITAIQALIEAEKAEQPMYQIGMPVVSMALTHFTEKNFMRLPPITFLLIMVTLFLLSGKLEVVGVSDQNINGINRPSRVISTLDAGDVVGEMGMIRSCERSATVVAATSAELLQINERMIKRLQWLYPPTAHRFFFNLMGILCDRLQNLTDCYLEETGPDEEA